MFGGSARNFKLQIDTTADDNALQRTPEVFFKIVEDTISWFFGGREISVDRETWNVTIRLIRKTIVEQLSCIDDLSDPQAFTGMFYHTHSTGYHSWATTFLKCLAGKIIDMRVLNLSEKLRQLIGEAGMGVAFESLGHETLVKSNVEHRAISIIKYQKPKEAVLKVPSRIEIFRAAGDISSLPRGVYGVPVNGNFPCVDAVIQPNTLLQFTTSNRHPGNEHIDGIRANLLERDKKNHRLIFVVPKELLNMFSKQENYGDIKQYKMTYCAFHEDGGTSMDTDA